MLLSILCHFLTDIKPFITSRDIYTPVFILEFFFNLHVIDKLKRGEKEAGRSVRKLKKILVKYQEL